MGNRTMKAWALLHKDGRIGKVGCHVLLEECPLAVFTTNHPMEKGVVVPCTITYALPKKKSKK